MTADGIPTAKGAPQFLGAGAPDIAGDPNAVAQWISAELDASVPAFADLANATPFWVGKKRLVVAEKTIYRHNGTQWKPWETTEPITYTPTWTQFSIGNGTQVAAYTVSAGVVTDSIEVTVGSTTGFTGLAFYPNPPFPPAPGTIQAPGAVWAFDSSASQWFTGVFAGAYILMPQRAINSFPFPWAAGDLLRLTRTFSI